MKNDNLNSQGLRDIAKAIRSVPPRNWWHDRIIIAAIITGICTVITGAAAIGAAYIALKAEHDQIHATRQDKARENLEEQLSAIQNYWVDITTVIEACKKYPSLLDNATHAPTTFTSSFDGAHVSFLYPQNHNRLPESNGIWNSQIASEISGFYSELPGYIKGLERPLTREQLNDPNIIKGLKDSAVALQEKAEKLKDSLEREEKAIQGRLDQFHDQ